MTKIPTMFVRDETKKGHPVTDQIKPECQWVLDGEGIATRKWDGTNVKVENGTIYKRQKPKERDYDEASYVECRRDDPADKWAFEAYDQLGAWARDGIYELIGPKVQGNPHKVPVHTLVAVTAPDASTIIDTEFPRTFEAIRAVLEASVFEGIVFRHPDGRMAKIKRRDFGLPWPLTPPAPPQAQEK